MKKLAAAIIATMALATGVTFADGNITPMPVLNISGTIIYQSGSSTNNGHITKSTLKSISFNTKSLIALLNASTNVQATMRDVAGTSQIPTNSYIIWSYPNSLIITNKDGFTFNLDGNDTVVTNLYDYGYLEFDDHVLIGSSSINDTNSAGSEQDKTGVGFVFDDENGNVIEATGNGTLTWTYSAVKDGVQKKTLTLNLHPAGYDGEVDGAEGLPQSVNITGSGSITAAPYGEPFYLWYSDF